jgi:hypothetical protein
MARPARKARIEGCPHIDVRQLSKGGHLRSAHPFSSLWSRRGNAIAQIEAKAQRDQVIIRYLRRRSDVLWEQTMQTVPLVWAQCRFGGARPFFRCTAPPGGRACNRRVMRLYAIEGLFACRRCHHLSYSSQRETILYRGLGRAQKIREMLGGHGGFAYPFPDKPLGMHWRRYDRLRRQCETLQERLDRRALGYLALSGRLAPRSG